MSKYLTVLFLVLLFALPVRAEIYEVTTRQAEQKIADTLVKAGEGEKFRVRFFGMNQEKMFLSGQPLSVDVTSFDYDKKRGMFKATLKYMNGQQQAGVRDVSGRFEEVAMIPVLKQGVKRGTIIAEDNLDFIEHPVSGMNAEVLTRPEEIIGKSAARFVSQMRALKRQDVSDPTVVKKDEMVTMIYRKGLVEIKTQGTVLQDAAAGRYTQVKNVKSGAVLQARVEGNGIVLIEGLKGEDDENSGQNALTSSGGTNNENIR